MTEPCPDCGSTSPFHRRHPVTDREVDYDKTCATCRHFSERTAQKATVYSCAHAGRINHPGQRPPAYPGCVLHEAKR